MRHLYSLATLTAVCLVVAGCSGTTDPAADTIDLGLSEPSGGANANLARFDTANDWQRTRNNTALSVFAGQTPGPGNVTTRSVRCVLGNAIPNTEYSLNTNPDVNYVEYSETVGGTVRTWRSNGGMLRLGADNAKETQFTLTNVTVTARSGSAAGSFKIQGPMIIRF